MHKYSWCSGFDKKKELPTDLQQVYLTTLEGRIPKTIPKGLQFRGFPLSVK